MGAVNHFKGKYDQGTFSQGQGPILGIAIKTEGENKGLLHPTSPERNLSAKKGQGDGLDGRAEEKGFDIHGASYKGPQNWQPTNRGETPNYAVNKGS